MPLYHLKCRKCGKGIRRILESTVSIKFEVCQDCGGSMKREPKAPSTQMLERLDNGAMTNAIERLSNAEELHREHASSDPRFRREER